MNKIPLQQYRDADPTTFSVMYDEGLITGRYEDVQAGELADYHMLDFDACPQIQQFVSRLLKGVVNVADVVRGSSFFYSRVFNTSKIEESISLEEVDADVRLLRILTDDYDRWIKQNRFHNCKYENGKAVYFDFACARLSFLKTVFDQKSIFLELQHLDEFGLERILQKINVLKALYQSSGAERFFESILKFSGFSLSDEEMSIAFTHWSEGLDCVKNAAESLKIEFSQKAA